MFTLLRFWQFYNSFPPHTPTYYNIDTHMHMACVIETRAVFDLLQVHYCLWHHYLHTYLHLCTFTHACICKCKYTLTSFPIPVRHKALTHQESFQAGDEWSRNRLKPGWHCGPIWPAFNMESFASWIIRVDNFMDRPDCPRIPHMSFCAEAHSPLKYTQNSLAYVSMLLCRKSCFC